MDRFINKYGRIWYLFQNSFTASFTDHSLSFKKLGKDYKNNKIEPDCPYTTGPNTYLNLLPEETLRLYSVYPHLPIKVTFEGEQIGYSVDNSGYSAADLGSGVRPIHKLVCQIGKNETCLTLDLEIEYSVVLEESLYGERSKQDLEERNTNIRIEIPFEDVPEVLNMDEKTRREFKKNHVSSGSQNS